MSHLDPFDDAVLGHMVWDIERNEWRSRLELPSGAPFSCSITPEDNRVPLTEQGIDEIRACIKWLIDNEPDLRRRIADAMFDWWFDGWYDEEIDTVTTKDGFAATISLAGANVLEDRQAHLVYNDGDMIGGHAIVLTIDSTGQITMEPEIWG